MKLASARKCYLNEWRPREPGEILSRSDSPLSPSVDLTSFRAYLREINLDKSVALEAQHIGAMPSEELEHAAKHYLVEALALFDRLDQAPHRVAHELLHKIGLEAAKRQRRHRRVLGQALTKMGEIAQKRCRAGSASQ